MLNCKRQHHLCNEFSHGSQSQESLGQVPQKWSGGTLILVSPQSFCMCYSGIMLQFPSDSTGNYQQDAAKRQTAGIKFTQAKNQFFFSPRRGNSLHRFMSNLAGPTGMWVCLAVQNFTSIATGVGMRPQNITNFHFLVKDSIDQFRIFLGAFIRQTIAHH